MNKINRQSAGSPRRIHGCRASTPSSRPRQASYLQPQSQALVSNTQRFQRRTTLRHPSTRGGERDRIPSGPTACFTTAHRHKPEHRSIHPSPSRYWRHRQLEHVGQSFLHLPLSIISSVSALSPCAPSTHQVNPCYPPITRPCQTGSLPHHTSSSIASWADLLASHQKYRESSKIPPCISLPVSVTNGNPTQRPGTTFK